MILVLVLLSRMGIALGNQSLPALAPFLRVELDLSRAALGMLFVVDRLAGALTIVQGGLLADRFGARHLMAWGAILTGFGLFALALAHSVGTALPGLVLMGVGVSVGSPAGTLAIVHWFKPRQRGTAMGLKQTSVPLGAIIAALTIPPIAVTLGWRGAVVGLGALAVVCGVAVVIAYPEHHAVSQRRLSTTGGWGLDLLRRRNVLVVCAYGFVMGAMNTTMLGYLLIYLTEVLRADVVIAGWLLAGAQVGGLISRMLWGLLSDRWFGGRRRETLALISAVGTATVLCLSLAGAGTSFALMSLLSLSIGISIFGWQPMHLTVTPEQVDAEQRGRAIGLSSFILQIGQVIGPPVFGFAADQTGSYRLGCLVLATLGALVTTLTVVGLHERPGRV